MSTDFNILTSKQKKVYLAIESFINEKGFPPTVREIGEMIGEKTPGAVQGILNRLEKKGAITRELGMARSIKLSNQDSNYQAPVYLPEVKKISTRNVNDLLNIYNIEKYQPMSKDVLTSDASDYFIIKCPDNSLCESGISYNDYLLINRKTDIVDGDIVIVLYNNHTILRRYFVGTKPHEVILKADSDLLNQEHFNLNDLVVVGKMTGKITLY